MGLVAGSHMPTVEWPHFLFFFFSCETLPMPEYRTETDSMGPIRVPADRYYGAQTARSLVHFAVGADTMPRPVIRAFGVLKKAAALTNRDLGLLPADRCDLIARAADEVIAGKLDD